MLYLVKSPITSSQSKPDNDKAAECGVQNEASAECGVCTDQIFAPSVERRSRARAGMRGQAAASVPIAKGAFAGRVFLLHRLQQLRFFP